MLLALRLCRQAIFCRTGIFALYVLVFSLLGCGKSDEERVLYSIRSPNLTWIIDVVEHTHNGTFSTVESYQLDLIRIRRQGFSEDSALIFSVDSEGDDNHRPVVTWVTNEKLLISVPKGSSIEHWSTQYRGLEVDVVFR